MFDTYVACYKCMVIDIWFYLTVQHSAWTLIILMECPLPLVVCTTHGEIMQLNLDVQTYQYRFVLSSLLILLSLLLLLLFCYDESHHSITVYYIAMRKPLIAILSLYEGAPS